MVDFSFHICNLFLIFLIHFFFQKTNFIFLFNFLSRDAEGELSLCAGDYLLVWTSGEPQGGYLDAELLDGRRGLVPASFVQRLIGLLFSLQIKHRQS